MARKNDETDFLKRDFENVVTNGNSIISIHEGMKEQFKKLKWVVQASEKKNTDKEMFFHLVRIDALNGYIAASDGVRIHRAKVGLPEILKETVKDVWFNETKDAVYLYEPARVWYHCPKTLLEFFDAEKYDTEKTVTINISPRFDALSKNEQGEELSYALYKIAKYLNVCINSVYVKDIFTMSSVTEWKVVVAKTKKLVKFESIDGEFAAVVAVVYVK